MLDQGTAKERLDCFHSEYRRGFRAFFLTDNSKDQPIARSLFVFIGEAKIRMASYICTLTKDTTSANQNARYIDILL